MGVGGDPRRRAHRVVWTRRPARGLESRLAKDGLPYLLLPGLIGAAYGRDLGWRVNRRAIRNAALLPPFALPIYLVGSSLPTVRSYCPMWPTGAALSEFLPHALMQFVVIPATGTYYPACCVSASARSVPRACSSRPSTRTTT